VVPTGIRELYEARRAGRFTLRHHLEAWVISTRFFALPWPMLYCLFGASLAGIRDWGSVVAASVVVCLVLLAGHFRNNYRDVELGVDRYVETLEEAERTVSTLKPYTAAAWLVPLRITSVGFQRVNEYLFLGLSLATYALTLGSRLHTLPVYLLGVFFAETYTDVWKRRGLGEVAAFMGHGYLSTLFGYLSQAADPRALLVGLVPGLASGLAYSVDQYVDIRTDFVRRVRSLAEAWFNSRLPLSLYVLVVYTFFLGVLHVFVTAGVYPRGVLLVFATLPLVLANAPRLEYSRERALRDLVLTMVVLVPLLMLVGALLG
jgi:1,4-dihydroxy-2-naphthoate octaprenyltransferase